MPSEPSALWLPAGSHSVAVSYAPLPADWQPGDPPPELFRRLTGDAGRLGRTKTGHREPSW